MNYKKVNNKNKELNFDLDLSENRSNTQEIDYLLDNKQHKNKLDDTSTFFIKKSQLKSKKLQSYVSEEVIKQIKIFKTKNNIKKESEAIEYLLRKALGLKQN